MILYKKSYIDKIIKNKDTLALYQIICALEATEDIGNKLWLACRLLELVGSIRSGVWQWYETIDTLTSNRIVDLLRKFELEHFAFKYQYGIENWKNEEKISVLDNWLLQNENEINRNILQLIEFEIFKLCKISR